MKKQFMILKILVREHISYFIFFKDNKDHITENQNLESDKLKRSLHKDLNLLQDYQVYSIFFVKINIFSRPNAGNILKI